VRAEARFEKLAAFANRLEMPARSFAVAIISSQIAKHLFAFKNRCRLNLFSLPSTTGHISTITAPRQTHFHPARRKPLHLRPQEREPFQPGMCLGFTFNAFYSRSHCASSRAQYVMIMSAPARLSAVMISRTAARSSKSPFSTALLTIAYSPLT
jgi:hypothetical protein